MTSALPENFSMPNSAQVPAGPDALVETIDLTKTYGDVKALRGVSLSVPNGSCTALVGPNGAGKTTLLDILQGLRKADSGHVRLFGKVREFSDRSFVNSIGVASQSIALNSLLTVRELFQLYAVLYDNPWRPEELMERLNLWEKADARFGRLSGGQKRRVSVGLALIGRPGLLMLDEPTGELDPQARRRLWELINDQRVHHGQTVLLATHQMEEVESLCDQVIIIDEGQIKDVGSPDDLIARHCPEYRLKFEILPGFDRATLGSHKVEYATATGRGFETARVFLSDLNEAYQVMDRIRNESGSCVAGMGMHKMSLDDVFIKITGRELRD